MNSGIGAGKTREDHKAVSDQMFAGYAEGRDLRGLVAIVGKEALSERDTKLLEFADLFEQNFVRQGRNENRTIAETLDIGWKILSHLPINQLGRIDNKYTILHTERLSDYHGSRHKTNSVGVNSAQEENQALSKWAQAPQNEKRRSYS
jgi:vacuolar-type H+-ATPase subunit B/Vma2